MRRGLAAAAAAALAAGALAACGVPARETYQVTGVVHGVSRERDQVRIAHDEVPGFMPAMTMNFDVASGALLDGIEPGMRVRFELERQATLLRIIALEPTGERAPVDEAPTAGDEVGAAPEPAPGFELVDQDGRPVALAELRGSAVLLDFIFTRCPGPCPILTASRAALQRELPPGLAERTRFVSITLDPAHDTPERLRAYAEERGADLARWSFLTGDPERVASVVGDYGVGTVVRADGTLDHLVVTFLIDPRGRIARRYLGLEHAPDELLAGLREVLG